MIYTLHNQKGELYWVIESSLMVQEVNAIWNAFYHNQQAGYSFAEYCITNHHAIKVLDHTPLFASPPKIAIW
jgi:hypothetical protein